MGTVAQPDAKGVRSDLASLSSIRRGDLICQVNAESASAAAMAAELMKARSLSLRVSRKKLKHVVRFHKELVDNVFSAELTEDDVFSNGKHS